MSKNSKSRVILMFALMFVLLLSVTSLQAQDKDLQPAPDGVTPDSTYYGNTDNKVVSNAPQAMGRTVNPGEIEQVSIIVTLDESFNIDTLEKVSGGTVIHTYDNVFNGVSMLVAGEAVEGLSQVSGVTGIYLDQLMQLDTDASPEFIGADVLWNDLGGQEHAGEGVIVGILDSGVWPEHPSFSDPDPFGNAYDAPTGAPLPCEFGDTDYNENDVPFDCNNKLIGAYDFTATYKALVGLLPTEFNSGRDSNGHGSHTATTSAGNGGVSAELLGVDRGVVSGIAPRAYVISYKVCGEDGCYNSDSIAAVEQAILDGVDVINFSISGGGNPYSDAVSQAFASAYANGVFVAASAGNSGPGPDTVAHREPWTTTVAASTSDRHFVSTATLVADNGDELVLQGATVTAGIDTPTDVVMAVDFGDELCLAPFAPGTFNGEIVVCERGVNARVAKSFNVAAGGAGGMLLYNPANQGLATDNHYIPSVHFDGDDGVLLTDFMATHTGVTATFTGGEATAVPGDMMASFSSRGGPGQTLGISKPDITAPGVQILAGNTPFPATSDGGQPGQLFQAIQGTSMSSPHIAGSAALIKAANPDWTPGQIKSAMMLTANGTHVKEDGVTPADPFDYGSGRIDLARAADSPLTMDETIENYNALADSLWDANYPSLYVPVMPGRITVERTVHNELNQTFVGYTYVVAPDDVHISIDRIVRMPANSTGTASITVDASEVPLGEVRFATVYIYSQQGVLRFPVTIVRNQPVVTLEQSCDPVNFRLLTPTNCTITATNTSFDEASISITDHLPNNLLLNKWSLEGADSRGRGFLSYEGTLAGAQAPLVDVAVDPVASPAGYLPMAGFGPVVVAATDESISNYNVPAFTFAGETYSRIGIVSNGYVVLGGGTQADVDYVNTDLPDPAAPNNIVAPFWTDLNPGAGGRVLLALVGDGTNSWMVVEWEGVHTYGDDVPNTFQVWISYTQPDDISFVYGTDITDGDGGFLTIGAENAFGSSGNTVYFNGVGTPPAPSYPDGDYEVDVFSTPGQPGESHTISFEAWGVRKGEWTNCAEMESDAIFGTNIACVNGEISRR